MIYFLMDLIIYLGPLLLSSAHFIGYKFSIKSKDRMGLVKSFSAGFTISYVFLLLFPEVDRLGKVTSIHTSILALLGFVYFHSALKFVFKNENIEVKRLSVDIIHLITSAGYNFLMTFLAIELIEQRESEGLIIFMILLLHIVLSDMAHSKSDNTSIEKSKLPVILLSSFAAVIFTIFVDISIDLRAILFAITSGSIVYITIREELPKDSEGKPVSFLCGTLVFLLLFAIL